MEGFFTKKETESKSRPDGRSLTCVTCNLHKKCKSPRMAPYGKFKKGILNIGEAPGEHEDNVGKPWQGKAGKLLQRTYEKLGINLFEDCLNINSVLCRPTDSNGNNRTPTNYEIECCRKNVLKVIDEYKPKIIILLGNAAVLSLIGYRWKKDLGGIFKWRGWTIPDQDFKTWICPVFHPSYIERTEGTVENVIWTQDLENAFKLKNIHFLVHVKPRIKIIEDLSKLTKKSLNAPMTMSEPLIAFDYETTGIKPHAIGHRIVCCSVAFNENLVYVFMMFQSKRERQPLIDLLTNPKIGKIAQNMKFEHTWTKVRLKEEVQNWKHDTMLMSHILDNRQGVTSLQFQVYVQFGIIGYKDETEPYINSGDKNNGNSFNKIMELIAKPGGKESLMKRCALDSIYEYRLAMIQMLNSLPF